MLLLALGLVAIAFPYVTTIAAKVLLGYLILIGGVAHVVHAVMSKDWRGFLVNLLIGVLYVVAGAWLAFFPLTACLVLTVFLAAVLVAEGVLQIALGYRVRPEDGWLWIALSGVASIIVGALIWAELPSSAVWAHWPLSRNRPAVFWCILPLPGHSCWEEVTSIGERIACVKRREAVPLGSRGSAS